MQAAIQFQIYLETEKRYSGHTLLAYEEDLSQFLTFAELNKDEQLREVNFQLVRGWIVDLMEKGLSNRSVSRKISCLRSFFKWLLNEGKIDQNPMLRIRGPKVEKRLPQFVKESEIADARIEQLFAANFEGIRDRLMFELFYQTGVQIGRAHV